MAAMNELGNLLLTAIALTRTPSIVETVKKVGL